MTKIIAIHIIDLLIVLPIIFLTLKNRKSETIKVVLIFSSFFLVNSSLLYLPIEFEQLKLINGKWNWTGKIFAIVGSLLFLLIYKKYNLKDYHLTLKQNENFKKKGLLIVLIIFIVYSINYYFAPLESWNTETIFFQMTMPGIDEEIAFRGIMLGLLTKILKPTFRNLFFHPSIIVTSLLFGLVHGLSITETYEFSFKWIPFLNTMFLGMIWGWMTLKSGSILLALISHNLGNVSNYLIRMK